ncbi:metal transporter CNNM like protein [Babesia gibsoni]|uniref:Metal transporter CNNM like protein n=1 Tax=Babesia gibsoni TaxID=33632 RepID=A0AAD8LQ97_BABGI|nr:metal transporter CNNM like protein [Babesia gibsoni]
MCPWAKALLALICAFSSALFSGLMLGFLSLDLMQLQLLTYADATSPKDIRDKSLAKRILPLRRDPNLLLATLIFSNSMVNALMVLLLGDLLDVTGGFVVSSLVMALLGEIAPQSIFMKYSLPLCGFFAAPLRVLIILMYPLCKPLSMILDYLLGPYTQVIYSRQQFKALVDLQLEKGNVLTQEEAKMLKCCLEMSSVKAESIMVPIDTLFCIEEDTLVTKDVVNNIAKSGFTNIPIIAFKPDKTIIGFLSVNDLLMLDTTKSYNVTDIFDSIGKPTYAADADSAVDELIAYFKGDSSIVVVVRKAFVDPDSDGDPVYKHIGIITIGDVMDVIIRGTMSDDYGAGLGGTDFVIRRMNTQMEKYKKLSSIANVHTFSLNSIMSIFPLQDASLVLKALELKDCTENMELLSTQHIYTLSKNTLLPSGCTLVLLRGTVGGLDDMQPLNHSTPFLISSAEMERTVITLSDCEVVEVDMTKDYFY